MILQYKHRILAALPGDTPIELYRTRKPLLASTVRFWVRDLSPAWTTWVESVTPDGHTVGPRWAPPKTGRDGAVDSPDRIILTPEEKERAGIHSFGV